MKTKLPKNFEWLMWGYDFSKIDFIKQFQEKIKKADLLITAVGERNLIIAEMIKPNAVVIDIGITKEDGKIYGDVDFDEVKELVLAITPVPGGVGPVVVAKVLENTWKLANKKLLKSY